MCCKFKLFCRNFRSYNYLDVRRLSLVFYGSDHFSLQSLDLICAHKTRDSLITKLNVITKPATVVDKYALKNNLDLFYWPHQLEPNEFDLGIVVSFGQLIDSDSINRCRHGMINIHPSLLPRWRGSAPIPRAVIAGDKESGITIVTIKPNKFDIGDILLQQVVPLQDNVKAKDLFFQLGYLGAKLLIKCIENLDFYFANSQPQFDKGVCYAKKLKKDEGYIDWTLMTAAEVDRKFRGLDGFIPVYCKWINDSKLKLFQMIECRTSSSLNWNRAEMRLFGKVISESGICFYNRRLNALCFKCRDHQWVAFSSLSLDQHPRFSANRFYDIYMKKKLAKPIVLRNVNCH